jgi:anti-sigma B factor antagonist
MGRKQRDCPICDEGSGLYKAGESTKMTEEINIEITKTEANAAVVAFKSPSMGDVDAISAVSTKIKEFVQENQPQMLIFDFEAVRFFSSLVLGLLLDIHAKLASRNGEVLISAINPELHRVFKIASLDKVFRFFPDRRSALEAISAD